MHRITALQHVMRTTGVDLVAIGPTANMQYLLGHVPFADERLCLLLVTSSSATLVVPAISAAEFDTYANLPLYSWTDSAGPENALQAALSHTKVHKLAVDGGMRADSLLDLLRAVSPHHTIPVSSLLAPLRAHKSTQEIEVLMLAAAQADRAMQAAVDACQVGATEADVAWAAKRVFLREGAQSPIVLVASGPNGANPHHLNGRRPLQQGDAIVIDMGAILDGYYSDITRMVHLGKPSSEFLQPFDAVLAANEQARAAVKPGVTAHEIDRAARAALEDAGLGEFFIHRTGHGLGMDIHEHPSIMAGDQTIVETGMVFSIEPGVYFPGRFGIRIEDIVAVTGEGMRLLTSFDHQLIVK